MIKNRENLNILMKKALKIAAKAIRRGEIPVGSLLLKDGKILAKSHNLTRIRRDPTAHAEMEVIRKAAGIIKNERLSNTTLLVTLEPCAMCAGAIVQARISTVVYGAKDPKAGACGSVFRILPNKKLNHRPKVVGGVLAKECGEILTRFFRRRRKR